MSIINAIREANSNKQELIPSTVRIPKDLHEFIDKLSEHLDKSRQETMLELLKEGINAAKSEYMKLEIENTESRSFHILNTNKKNNEEDHFFMINEGTAAAFYDPWKYNINKIKNGDFVFLYENKIGIIAYGKGTGNTIVTDQPNGDKNERHYQKLEEFKILKKPLEASRIKSTLERDIVFMRTMSSIHDGQKILQAIKSLELLEKIKQK